MVVQCCMFDVNCEDVRTDTGKLHKVSPMSPFKPMSEPLSECYGIHCFLHWFRISPPGDSRLPVPGRTSFLDLNTGGK